jgi:hypothetical protein
MSKIETREEVFPFECGYPRCDKVYDIGQFKEIALLWGFIYLTCGEFDLIGLTCPDCHFTTVNKYKNFTPDFSLKILQEHNAPRDSQGKIFVSDFVFFIPFSPLILVESKLLSASVLEQMPTGEIAYQIPHFAQPKMLYPDKIRTEFPYSITEESIQNLCVLEYERKVKAIPRIVSYLSIYQYTDNWLSFSQVDQIPFSSRQFISDQFDLAFRFNIGERTAAVFRTAITIDEIRDIDFDDETLAWGREKTAIHWENFFQEYKRARNHIDFEITYTRKLLDKYIRLFFWMKGQGERFMADFEEFPIPPEEPSEDYLFLEDMTPAQLKAAKTEKTESDINDTKQEDASEPTQRESVPEPEDYCSPIESAKRRDPQIAEQDNVFYRHGKGVWFVKFKGKETTIPYNKRVFYLALLLKDPLQEFGNDVLSYHVNTIFLGQKADISHIQQNVEEPDNAGVAKHSGIEGESDKFVENMTKEQRSDTEKIIKLYLEGLTAAEESENFSKTQKFKEQLEELKESIKEVFRGTFQYDRKLANAKKKHGDYYFKFFVKTEITTAEYEKFRKNIDLNIRKVINEDLRPELPELADYLKTCISVKQISSIYDPNKHPTDKSIRWYVSY